MKRIFLISDVHEDYESLYHALEYIKDQDPSILLFLGDLMLSSYYSMEDIEKENLREIALDNMRRGYGRSRKILDRSGVPYRVIPGNYDSPDFGGIFQEENLHKRTEEIEGFRMTGYGGADAFPPHLMRILSLIVQYDSDELFEVLKSGNPDFVVSHNPPYGLCDTLFDGRQVGDRRLRDYINDYGPEVVVSGHIHESGPLGNNPRNTKGVVRYDDTVVINPGNLGTYALINPIDLEVTEEFKSGTFSELVFDDENQLQEVRHYKLDRDGNAFELEKYLYEEIPIVD